MEIKTKIISYLIFLPRNLKTFVGADFEVIAEQSKFKKRRVSYSLSLTVKYGTNTEVKFTAGPKVTVSF